MLKCLKAVAYKHIRIWTNLYNYERLKFNPQKIVFYFLEMLRGIMTYAFYYKYPDNQHERPTTNKRTIINKHIISN